MTSLPDAVARYAGRLHAVVPGHHGVSPLGAWLLLALVVPAAEGAALQRLEEALGMPAADACDAACTLLEDPHPAVAAAVALWARAGLDRPRYEAWAGGLPAAVARGALPDQAGLDAWARERTLGLVGTFPGAVQPDTVAVLASVLATKVSWGDPFVSVPSRFSRWAWADRVATVLATPRFGHLVGVVPTGVGPVGVHAVDDEEESLTVVSVVGPPGAARSEVLATAHDVAREVALRDRPGGVPGALEVSGLPLGDGHAWTVAETVDTLSAGTVRATALMPAWEAETGVDLSADEALGFVAAGESLVDLLRPLPEPGTSARQSAVARYTATGFEAAAATALVAAGGARPAEGVVRTLEVRFDRPYAVVAVARSGPVAWVGLPVFSAWVEDPVEAQQPVTVPR